MHASCESLSCKLASSARGLGPALSCCPPHRVTARRLYGRSPTSQTVTRRLGDFWAHAKANGTQEDSAVETDVQKDKAEDEEEVPIWVRRETMRKMTEEEGQDLPWAVYLVLSGFVSIAVVGAIFEFFNKKAYFGIVQPDSLLYLPTLALFVFAGTPLAGVCFFKAVELANKQAEQIDRIDRGG